MIGIIAFLIGILLWILIIQRDHWEQNAYNRGREDGELKATNYEEFSRKMKDGHTPWRRR